MTLPQSMESLKHNPSSQKSYSVRDLMSTELITLYADDTFKTLKDLMEWKKVRHVPVVNEQEELVGLISQRDFLNLAVSKLAKIDKAELDELYTHIKIKDIMGKKVTFTSPDTDLSEAAALMVKHKFGCLPVIEDGRLVGIITEADFVRSFIDYKNF